MFDHTERFAWTGKKFDLRAEQCNCSEIYTSEMRILKKAEVFDKRMGAILIVEQLKILNEYTIGMPRHPFKNPSGNFVINILESWTNSNSKMLSNICIRLWRLYGILRVVFIFNGENEKIFYLDPFHLNENGKYGRIFGEYLGNNSKSLIISDPTYPINFNGYPFRVFFFDRYPSAMTWNIYPKAFLNSYQSDAQQYSTIFGGFDGIFIGNIAKLLNITVITKYPRENDTNTKYGWRSKNGTIEGSVGQVMYSRADIGGNGHFIQGYGTTSVTFLNPIYHDLLCLITAKAKQIPKSMAIINCFEIESWRTISILYIILGILWYIFKHINYQLLLLKQLKPIIIKYEYYHNNNLITNIINMWLLLTCHSINIRKSNGFERLFLIGCMLSSILFSSSIQGYLAKSFVKITYEKDISTLKELNDANLKIVVPSAAFEDLFGNKTGLKGYMAELANKIIINELDQRYIAINYRNVSFFDRKTDFDIIKEEFQFPNGTTLLNLVKECPRITFLSFIVRRGWAFEEKFNRIIGLMDTGGFRLKWFDWSKKAMLLKWRVKNLRIMVENFKENTFDVKDIKIAILLHILGNLLSLIVFISEYFLYYTKKKCF